MDAIKLDHNKANDMTDTTVDVVLPAEHNEDSAVSIL